MNIWQRDLIFPPLCNMFLEKNAPIFRTCQVKWKTSSPDDDKYIFMHFSWNKMKKATLESTKTKGERRNS